MPDDKKFECECNEKKFCCKMQKNTLKIAIYQLKIKQYSTNVILGVLKSLDNLLSVYECQPCCCLQKEVERVSKNIKKRNGPLYKSEKVEINMLIAELEAFLSC